MRGEAGTPLCACGLSQPGWSGSFQADQKLTRGRIAGGGAGGGGDPSGSGRGRPPGGGGDSGCSSGQSPEYRRPTAVTKARNSEAVGSQFRSPREGSELAHSGPGPVSV